MTTRTLPGNVFIAHGDITLLRSDAIAFSASNMLACNGNLYSSFERCVPGFRPWYRSLRRNREEPFAVGTTFWMPLEPARRPQGVVVVVSTGRSSDEDKAGTAVRRAIDRAVRELRTAGRRDRLLIALPGFRLGMGGDHYQRLASAQSQVYAAKAALQDHEGVDVAFLTYTPALYRIFLEARQRVNIAASSSEDEVSSLEQAIADDSAVLFIGAGLSAGAGLPGWNHLIDRLKQQLGLEGAADLDHLDVAQWFRETRGKEQLAQLLGEIYGGDHLPTLAHYLLLSLPVRHILTTNYDQLLERTLLALKRFPEPIVRQADVARTGGPGVYVVKIHGDATHASEIVLARDDYHAYFEQRPAMALLLEGLLLNKTFFFVGYSLRDPNFQQIFSRIARMLRESRQPAFATSFEAQGAAGPFLRAQWESKQLKLITVPGVSPEQQNLEFLRFLDALSERITMKAPALVLAADMPPPPGVGRLRDLFQSVGQELESLCEDGAAEEDVGFLAQVLDFLVKHGWRPSLPGSLCSLYVELAKYTGDLRQKRRLLVTALRQADTLADVQRLREILDQHDEP
ncbi:MAG: SIR2 family protein [Gemmataceae bacterium]